MNKSRFTLRNQTDFELTFDIRVKDAKELDQIKKTPGQRILCDSLQQIFRCDERGYLDHVGYWNGKGVIASKPKGKTPEAWV